MLNLCDSCPDTCTVFGQLPVRSIFLLLVLVVVMLRLLVISIVILASVRFFFASLGTDSTGLVIMSEGTSVYHPYWLHTGVVNHCSAELLYPVNTCRLCHHCCHHQVKPVLGHLNIKITNFTPS